MNLRRLLALVTLTLLLAGLALRLSRPTADRGRDPLVGVPVLPGLAGRLDSVAQLRLVGASSRTLVSLARRDGLWRVEPLGYAADETRVRRTLVALGNLQVVESKTSDPTRYASLGVEDTDADNATSLRIELAGSGAPVALLVGRQAGARGGYVRVPADSVALEARPALDLARVPRDWLQKIIVDLPADRVQAVDTRPASGPPWRAERATPTAAHFDLALPRGREMTSLGAADGTAHAVGALEFEDVQSAAGGVRRPPDVVQVSCFDGLVVTLEGWRRANEHWVRMRAEYNAPLADRYRVGDGGGAARQQAEQLNKLTSGWEYRIAAYRYDALFRERNDFVRR